MSKRRMMRIDGPTAEAIRRLHHTHPELGHDGIGRLLDDAGIFVDSHALRVFMEEHHMHASPSATWVSSSDPLEAYNVGLVKKDHLA